MKDKLEKNKKKKYSKPEVIFSKKIEVVSIVCSTGRLTGYICKKTAPCNLLYT